MQPPFVQQAHSRTEPELLPSAAPDTDETLTIQVARHRVRSILMIGVVFLLVMYLLGLFARYELGRGNLYGAIDRFHFNGEGNIPAWYASLLLLGAAVVVGLIAANERARRDPHARHWAGLTIILLFMAADEGAQFHELLTRPMSEIMDEPESWLRFTWVVPAALVAIFVGLAYLRFLLKLPVVTARGFVVAGVIYLVGAIGFEMVSGWYLTTRDSDVGYDLLAGVEEVLEKIGAIIALDTALAYLAARAPVIRFVLASDMRTSPPAGTPS